MSTSTAPTLRCPSCAATLRAGSDWCTLCYADLRHATTPTPAEEPAEVPPAPAASSDSPANVAGSADPAPRQSRGKHARRTPANDETSSTADEVEALANQMLAQLAASESKNPLGSVAGAVDSTGKRAVLMVGGAFVAMLLIFIVMAIAGALL